MEEWYPYIAGFFDGEGCIVIYKNKRTKGINFYHNLFVTATQQDIKPLKKIKQIFGGQVRLINRKNTKSNYFTWQASGKIALTFLKKISPYLIIKKEQALLGIKFQEEKSLEKPIYIKGNKHSSLNKFQIKKREKYKLKISILNHKFSKK